MKMYAIMRRLAKKGTIKLDKVNGVTVITEVKDYETDRYVKEPALMYALIEVLSPYFVKTDRPHGYFRERITYYYYNGKTIAFVSWIR